MDLRRAARGLVAGVAATAAMTAYQLAVAKARGEPLRTPVPRTWDEAPAPAQVAKRLADATGRSLTKEQVPLATQVMHWLYGVSWGPAFGLAVRDHDGSPLPKGLAAGTAVWAAGYAQLVPLGIYEEPWQYPARELALDLSYHLVYGVALAGAYAALRR